MIIDLATEQLKSLVRASALKAMNDRLPDAEKELNIRQAAKSLGMSVQAIRDNIWNIPHKIRNGRFYFTEKSLEFYWLVFLLPEHKKAHRQNQ